MFSELISDFKKRLDRAHRSGVQNIRVLLGKENGEFRFRFCSLDPYWEETNFSLIDQITEKTEVEIEKKVLEEAIAVIKVNRAQLALSIQGTQFTLSCGANTLPVQCLQPIPETTPSWENLLYSARFSLNDIADKIKLLGSINGVGDEKVYPYFNCAQVVVEDRQLKFLKAKPQIGMELCLENQWDVTLPRSVFVVSNECLSFIGHFEGLTKRIHYTLDMDFFKEGILLRYGVNEALTKGSFPPGQGCVFFPNTRKLASATHKIDLWAGALNESFLNLSALGAIPCKTLEQSLKWRELKTYLTEQEMEEIMGDESTLVFENIKIRYLVNNLLEIPKEPEALPELPDISA